MASDERYTEALERLVEVSRRLSRVRELPAVIEVTRHAVRELSDAEGATFVLREGEESFYADVEGVVPPFMGKRYPLDKCFGGWAILRKEPVLIEDMAKAEPELAKPYIPTPVGRMAVVPIRAEDPVGAIGAYWRQPGPIDPLTVRILQALADTASVAMENAILHGKLQERVRELEKRTSEALAATRAKSSFLANMSHEIRTPLNGVIGMTDLALKTCTDQKSQLYLQMAHDSGRLLLEIIGDILDFAKIEAGRMELSMKPFSLRELVQTMLHPLELNARQKGLRLGSTIDPGLDDMLIGDPGKLRQIIVNLISNAIKFTEKGSIDLTIAPAEEQEPPGSSKIHFSVADTGIGIPRDQQDFIFNSFAQAEPTRGLQHSGTGLGLAIVKALVEMMGGRIWLESEQEKGSVFHFTATFRLPQSGDQNAA